MFRMFILTLVVGLLELHVTEAAGKVNNIGFINNIKQILLTAKST